jgi:hypothetical protein
MRRRLTNTLTLAALLLCPTAANNAHAGARAAEPATRQSAQAAQPAAASYTARVKRDEARFTFTVPRRTEWRWREGRVHAREYMLAVRVSNEGKEFSFGFFLWKHPGSPPGGGDLSSLIRAGQASMFERASPLHVIVMNSGVTVGRDGDRVVIRVKGKKNVARLFSGRPAQVTFETELPGEPPAARQVAVTYED